MKERQSGAAAILNQFPLLLTLVAAGLIFLLMTGLKGCSKKQETDPSRSAQLSSEVPGKTDPADPGKTEPSDSIPTKTEAPTQQTDAPTEPATTDSVPTTEPVTTAAPTTDAPTTVPPTTTEPEPVYPTGFTTVDESYFSDALFLGDSRTDGLCLYCPVGDAKHYSGTSMTIFKIMETTDPAYGYNGVRALLKGEKFGKIYIMYGINEAGYDTDVWAQKYADVVAEIRQYQPDALIYIQSILYVTQKHEKNYPVFATKGLKEKNARLMELANGKDIFYLEVNDVLNDGTDHLPSEYTNDGAHLKAKYYYLWHDYLLEHAIVDAAHPWEPEEE